MNSGFGSGSRRIGDSKGVREGREKGGILPVVKGVGRTGKGPAAVPESMLQALGVTENIEEASVAGSDQEKLEQEIREYERQVALRAQRFTIYEEVEWICRVPHDDRVYVEKFIEDKRSPEDALQMLERLAARIEELRRYLDETEWAVHNTLELDGSDDLFPDPYFTQHRARLLSLEEDVKNLRLVSRRARQKAVDEAVERLCQDTADALKSLEQLLTQTTN